MKIESLSFDDMLYALDRFASFLKQTKFDIDPQTAYFSTKGMKQFLKIDNKDCFKITFDVIKREFTIYSWDESYHSGNINNEDRVTLKAIEMIDLVQWLYKTVRNRVKEVAGERAKKEFLDEAVRTKLWESGLNKYFYE